MQCQRWALFHLSSPASTSPPANQVREKQMYARTIHNMCVHQTVCSVYQCLSASVTMSSRPPPLSFSFHFLSPQSVFPSISLSLLFIIFLHLLSGPRWLWVTICCHFIYWSRKQQERRKEMKNGGRIINVAAHRNFGNKRRNSDIPLSRSLSLFYL